VIRAFDRACAVLRTRRADLDAGVDLRLKREALTVDDFPAIRSEKVPTEQASAAA